MTYPKPRKMNHLSSTSSRPLDVNYGIKMLVALSLYPFVWTICLGLGEIFQNQILILLTMCTWKVAWSLGSIIWIVLLVYHFTFFQSYRKHLIWPLVIMGSGCTLLYFIEKWDWFGIGSQYLNLGI
ncbi:MAG: hypothetical protein K1X82_00030 [Bacteroidia bacterium]|nr:hypothetical protein [Bacteroidia bacterium]